MISNTVFNQHENVLAEARFELTTSGFRSAALPIELFSPMGIGGEFYLLKSGGEPGSQRCEFESRFSQYVFALVKNSVRNHDIFIFM